MFLTFAVYCYRDIDNRWTTKLASTRVTREVAKVPLKLIDGGKDEQAPLDGEVLPPEEPPIDGRSRPQITVRDGCTAKQIGFANAVIGGMSLTDAYVAFYDTSRMTRKTIWEAASRAAAVPKVCTRILQGQQAKERVAMLTGRSIRGGLIQMLDDMTVTEEGAFKLKAIELLGKTGLVRLFENDPGDELDEDMSEAELLEEIERRLKAAFSTV